MLVIGVRMWRGKDDAFHPAIRCRRHPDGRLHSGWSCAAKMAVAGVLTGILSGMFGVGGGFLVVPALLAYAQRRGEVVALDHLALTPPRVSRFVEHLAERVPVWIACRSTLADDIGHVWQHLYKFERVELAPLTPNETRVLIEAAVDLGNIQAEARGHIAQIHRLSKGVPRILEEFLVELSAREYKMDTSFGMHLLELDRRIQELDLAVQSTTQPGSPPPR